jgi:UDP-N-acetylmuramate dehydrogenase
MELSIQEKVLLKPYTTWQVGGPAEYFCLPKTIADIKFACKWAQEKNLAVTVLAGGSNVLVSDQGVDGLVICLKYFNYLKTGSEGGVFRISCDSGVAKSELLKTYLKNKLAPAVFLAGIPGDVGGGVVMNAGIAESIKPREFVEIVESIEVLKPDLSVKKYMNADLNWSYRHCNGWQPGIIVGVTLAWPEKPDDQVLDKVRSANKTRLSKQPLDMPSCGSVFVNPPGHKAAQLIETCDLKGFQIGQAQVSKKHANFIVNLGGCSSSDLLRVIEHVKSKVKAQTNVSLQTEVIKIGRW